MEAREFIVESSWWEQATNLLQRRVPVVLQMNEVECGAASLAMVLSYFGRKTRVDECRSLLDVSRDGVTAQAIAREARGFGLQVRTYVAEPQDLANVPRPSILFWEFNHFVVLERWSPQRIDIVDPALGRRSLTAEAFDTAFTGVVMTFTPGIDFVQRRSAERRSWIGYFSGILREYPEILVQILGASLIVQVLALAGPIFTQILVDEILPARNLNTLGLLGIGIVILTAAHALVGFVRSMLMLNLQARLDARLMTNFVHHLLRLPFSFFQQRSSGDLLMRLRSNTILRETITGETLSLALDSVLVLTYLGYLFWQQSLLALVVVFFGALQVAILWGTTAYQRRLVAETLVTEADEQGYLVETLKGAATLKATGAEEWAFKTWENLFYRSLNATTRSNFAGIVIDDGRWFLRALAPIALLWVGIHQVMVGALTLGEMLALNSVALLFLSPLSSLVRSAQKIQLAGAHLDRITDVLDTQPEQTGQTSGVPIKLGGDIELRNVNFRYHAEAPYVLRDISLSIHAGQKVAIVGRSGSGKSTLGYLLLHLYQPTSGEILYDGADTRQLDVRELRQQFGVVLQEPFLFSGSIRQNIALHAPDASMERIREVARIAAIEEDIEALPMRYETYLAEDAGTTSGGQRQRLALARALAPSPAILLLDEATSHLDQITEQCLDANLDALRCTRIVIAHRLSTIRNADLIVVLEDGRIVERGTHEQLLAQNSHYAALVKAD